MIRFRCTCQHWLEAPLSEAGSSLQCPKCGRLRSIPELDELRSVEDDGTFRLAEVPWSQRSASRPAGEMPPSTRRASRPTHDPETGELIEGFDLRDDDGAHPQPTQGGAASPSGPASLAYAGPGTPNGSSRSADHMFGAAAASGAVIGNQPPFQQGPPPAEPGGRTLTLSYAGKRDYGRFLSQQEPIPLEIRPVHWNTVPLELLQPANVLVLAIVFVLHLVLQVFGLFVAAGALPMWIVVGLLVLVILAHYVNVIDETGPERRDEMPAVLRHLSFSEDFGHPLWSLVSSLVLCFAPALLLWRAMYLGTLPADATGAALVAGVGILGLLLFPAVLLTMTTSGTAWNALPHRLVRLILVAPLKYLLALILLLLGVACYALAISAGYILTIAPSSVWPSGPPINLYTAAAITYPSLFAAIYFIHAFGWMLGRIYQEHHDAFPWILQRHISTRSDEVKQLELQKAQMLRDQHEAGARRASRRVRSRLASPATEER